MVQVHVMSFLLIYDNGSTVVLIISESGCFNFQIVSNDNDIYLPIESTNEVTNTSCFGETNDIGDSDSDDLDGDNCLDDLCSGSITINISTWKLCTTLYDICYRFYF